VVIGPPGTGKTTFLKRQVEKIVASQSIIPINTSPVLVCSLTRTAAAEIAGRGLPIPRKACGTIHAHGYRSIKDRPPLLDAEFFKDWNRHHPGYKISKLQKINPNSEVDGWNAENEFTGGHGTACLTVATGLLHSMKPFSMWPKDIRNFYTMYAELKRVHGKIDYDDMILMASDHPPFDPKVILIDEAQDVSRLEWDLLRKWGSVAGALIAVGDDRQSLYEWRGADPSFLQDPSIPDNRRKVLSQSYRIPKAIHAKAEKIARELTTYVPVAYRPTDEEGSITYNNSTYKIIDPIMPEIHRFLDKGESVMLSVATNYMANNIARQLKEMKELYSNPWRITNRAWNPSIMHDDQHSGNPGTTTLVNRINSFMVAARPAHGDDRRMWNYRDLFNWTEWLTGEGFFIHGAKKAIRDAAKEKPLERITEADLKRWFFWPGEINAEVLDWFLKTDIGEERKFSEIMDWWAGRMDLMHGRRYREQTRRLGRCWDKHGYGKTPSLYVGTFHSFKGAEADHVFLWPDISLSAYKLWIGSGGADRYRDPILKQFYVGVTRARKTLSIGRPCKKLAVPL